MLLLYIILISSILPVHSDYLLFTNTTTSSGYGPTLSRISEETGDVSVLGKVPGHPFQYPAYDLQDGIYYTLIYEQLWIYNMSSNENKTVPLKVPDTSFFPICICIANDGTLYVLVSLKDSLN